MKHTILITAILFATASFLFAQEQVTDTFSNEQYQAELTLKVYKKKNVERKSLSYITLGWTMYNLDDLNESAELQGADTRGNSAFQFGFGHETYFDQVVADIALEMNLWKSANNDSIRTSLSELHLGYVIGFDVIKAPTMKLYPYFGINLGWLFYKTGVTDLPYDSLYTTTVPQDFRLDQLAVKLDLGLGYVIARPDAKRRPAIGIKAGYKFDVSTQDRWYRRYSSIDGAPNLQASGPYVKLVIGMRREFQPDED